MEVGQTFDLGRIYGAAEGVKGVRMENQLRQQQLDTQQVMTSTAKAAVDPTTGQYSAEKHAQALTAAGYPQVGQQLLAQQIETGTKFLNYVGTRAAMVNAENYPAFKAEMERSGLVPANILPAEYGDGSALYRLSQAMQGKVEEAYSAFQKLGTGPDGAEIWGQTNSRTNEAKGVQVIKPTQPKNPIAGQDANGEGFFDPQTGQRVLPNVRPRPRAAPGGGKPWTMKSADSNTIFRQVVTAYGGLYDPMTGQITGLNKDQAAQAQALASRASQLYQEGEGNVDHATAVLRAMSEGGGAPTPAPAAAPPANRPPLSSFRTR